MPNWVDSSWNVKGSVEDLEKMLKTLKGPSWGSQKICIFNPHMVIPMPEYIINASKDETLAQNQREEWYDWSVKNWGSKWEPSSISIWKKYPQTSLRLMKDLAGKKQLPGKVFIHFQTAWSPLTPFIEKVSKMFPKLTFVYAFIDEGGGFASVETWKEGDCTVNWDLDNGDDPKKVFRSVKSYLRLPKAFDPKKFEHEE